MGSSATTLDTALPEDRRRASSHGYMEYDWENRDGLTCSTRYEGTGSTYHTSLYRNYDDQWGPYRLH